MDQYAYYVISDIHLERKNEYKKNFLLNSINLVIDKNKTEGKKTIVVFSGDIDNGINAYEWFKKIDAEIIYTAGNHEFWNNDYYETIDSLKRNMPSNVHFLHNDFVECGEYIFLGATMWTDVGKSLNDDLKYVSNGVMNDNYYIKAQKWYTSDNLKKLKEITPKYAFEGRKDKFDWNILIEQEENEKTINFFKSFNTIKEQMLKLKEEFDNSEQRLNSKYNAISKENYESLHKAINLKNYTYQQWLLICKEFNLLGYEAVDDDMIASVTKEQEAIFNKLSKMNYEKEIVVVSHHLPFLEERLIGHYSHSNYSQKLLNQKADSPIYNIRNGLNDYPQHNYFYRISKGEFSRDESILEAIHYSNNGAVNLPYKFYTNVKAWCHGHDHTLNYQDYLKGVNIITNPLSYSLDVFTFSENGVHLNSSYKKYHKIDTDEQEQKEVETLKGLVLKPIEFNKLKNKNQMIQLWIFILMNKEKIYQLLEGFTQNNKKFFTYLAKNPQFGIGQINDKQYQKLQEFGFINYYYFNELKNELDILDIAYAARKEESFSYATRFNKTYEKNISDYFLGDNYTYNIIIDTFPKETFEEYGYEHLSSQLFKNIYLLNKGMKRIKYLKSILDQFENVESITDLYNKELPDLYPKEPREKFLFDRELDEKRRKIMDKYMTEEIKKTKEEQYRKKFNF